MDMSGRQHKWRLLRAATLAFDADRLCFQERELRDNESKHRLKLEHPRAHLNSTIQPHARAHVPRRMTDQRVVQRNGQI